MSETIVNRIGKQCALWDGGEYSIDVRTVDGSYRAIKGRAVVTIIDLEQARYEHADGTITHISRLDAKDDEECGYKYSNEYDTSPATVTNAESRVQVAYPIPYDCEFVPELYNTGEYPYTSYPGFKIDTYLESSGDRTATFPGPDHNNTIYYDPRNPPQQLDVAHKQGSGYIHSYGSWVVTNGEPVVTPKGWTGDAETGECSRQTTMYCCYDRSESVDTYSFEPPRAIPASSLPDVTLYIRKRLRSVTVRCRVVSDTGYKLSYECHASARRRYRITRKEYYYNEETVYDPEIAYADACNPAAVTAEYGSTSGEDARVIELDAWFGWNCHSPQDRKNCGDLLDYVTFDGWYVTSPKSSAPGYEEQMHRFSTYRQTTISLHEDWCSDRTDIRVEAVFRVSHVAGLLHSKSGTGLHILTAKRADGTYKPVYFDSFLPAAGCQCPERAF